MNYWKNFKIITILIVFWSKNLEVFVFEPHNINGTWSLPLKFLKPELAFSRLTKSSDLWVE